MSSCGPPSMGRNAMSFTQRLSGDTLVARIRVQDDTVGAFGIDPDAHPGSAIVTFWIIIDRG